MICKLCKWLNSKDSLYCVQSGSSLHRPSKDDSGDKLWDDSGIELGDGFGYKFVFCGCIPVIGIVVLILMLVGYYSMP